MLHYHWEHCRVCDGIQLIDQRGNRAAGSSSSLGSDSDDLCTCPRGEPDDRPDDQGLRRDATGPIPEELIPGPGLGPFRQGQGTVVTSGRASALGGGEDRHT